MADPARIQAKVSQFRSIDKKQLISRNQWGSIDFKSAVRDIDSIYELVDILNDLPLDRLPENAINIIGDALESALTWIIKIDTFNLDVGSPVGVRDEIVNNLSVQQNNLYIAVHQWIPFLAYLKGDIPAQLKQITEAVGIAQQNRIGFDEYLVSQRKEIDAVVTATRMASAKAGVGVFTDDFLQDASDRKTEGELWLRNSIAAAFVTVLIAFIFFFIRAPENQYAAIQFATSKVVILATLIGITAWCTGIYKANKHQETVSRHKAHALKTFQAFVAATDNSNVKDAVLLETTRAIFSHSQTGYLKGDASSESPSKVFEIFKSPNGD